MTREIFPRYSEEKENDEGGNPSSSHRKILKTITEENEDACFQECPSDMMVAWWWLAWRNFKLRSNLSAISNILNRWKSCVSVSWISDHTQWTVRLPMHIDLAPPPQLLLMLFAAATTLVSNESLCCGPTTPVASVFLNSGSLTLF